tara:strand:+ start:612 stop:755 length:144 start_codon:yes stop_codon:yes gene_type:complete
MTVLVILIPIAIIISFLGVVGVIWSIKNHQFDDLQKESERILFEDDK